MTKVSDRWSTISRLAVEGLVVNASILIVFALDAWWADLQLRTDVSEELEGMDRESNPSQHTPGLRRLHDSGALTACAGCLVTTGSYPPSTSRMARWASLNEASVIALFAASQLAMAIRPKVSRARSQGRSCTGHSLVHTTSSVVGS